MRKKRKIVTERLGGGPFGGASRSFTTEAVGFLRRRSRTPPTFTAQHTTASSAQLTPSLNPCDKQRRQASPCVTCAARAQMHRFHFERAAAPCSCVAQVNPSTCGRHLLHAHPRRRAPRAVSTAPKLATHGSLCLPFVAQEMASSLDSFSLAPRRRAWRASACSNAHHARLFEST